MLAGQLETALPVRLRRGTTSSRGSKGSYVYAEIKEAILSGQLAPGSHIDKSALCDRLGMSRFPVTTAINRLAFERLVVVAPQHGSFVAPIALREVLECMMLRAAIEGETAALAAERLPAGLVPALDASLHYQDAAVAAGDAGGFYALDVAFHHAILASLALDHAAAILDGLRTRLERIRRILTVPPGRMAETRDAHRAVRDGIAGQDPEAARGAMRRHLDSTAALFRIFADTNPSLFSDPDP